MIKYRTSKKNESLVEDPHELLLSLVDMGSLDADECLLACVAEMSDAECKRVLNSISLPNNCCGMDDDAEEDNVAIEPAIEPADDTVLDLDKHEDEVDDEDFNDEDEELEEEEDVDEAKEMDEEEEMDEEAEMEEEAELEARIRRLERNLRSESMNRNRIRRISRRNCS